MEKSGINYHKHNKVYLRVSPFSPNLCLHKSLFSHTKLQNLELHACHGDDTLADHHCRRDFFF